MQLNISTNIILGLPYCSFGHPCLIQLGSHGRLREACGAHGSRLGLSLNKWDSSKLCAPWVSEYPSRGEQSLSYGRGPASWPLGTVESSVQIKGLADFGCLGI